MANVSSSNGIEKYPLLRFNGYNNPWMTQKLGDLGTFIKGAPLSKADISNEGNPFVLYGELYTTYSEVTHSVKRKTDKTVEQQFYSKIGDVIMPTSGETPEDIATASCIMLPDVILAGDLLIYRTEQIDGRFVSYAIKNKVNKQISSVAQGKSVVHVRADELAKICITFPALDEQKKILNLLELLDTRIATQQSLIETLKKYKRGVSKRFFDEIHKDQNCEAKQFSEVFELIQNNTFSRECLTDENTDVLNVHYGDILVKYGSVLDPDIDTVPFIKSGTDLSKFSGSSYLQDGDVIFADTAEDYTVGKMCEIINVSNRKILSGLHTMPFRPTITFAPMYLGYYLNSAAFRTQILPMIQGAKVSSISKSEMKKTIIHIPSIERQTEIVSILNALDKRIKRTELILAELKEMKKGLLQNLFI